MGMGREFVPSKIMVAGLGIEQIMALVYLLNMQGIKHATNWTPHEIAELGRRWARTDKLIGGLQDGSGLMVDVNSVQSLLDRIVYLQRTKTPPA